MIPVPTDVGHVPHQPARPSNVSFTLLFRSLPINSELFSPLLCILLNVLNYFREESKSLSSVATTKQVAHSWKPSARYWRPAHLHFIITSISLNFLNLNGFTINGGHHVTIESLATMRVIGGLAVT